MSIQLSDNGGSVIARLERIPIWSLPKVFIWVIGLGFLFTFYDIFDVNVSFIQTSTAIIPGATPETASNYIGYPVMFNLLGYVVGSLILSPIADRIGRRNTLLTTMLITGLGSLYTAFTNDYVSFIVARAITGIGVGADLAVVNVFINEVAPTQSRVKYTSLLQIVSATGAFLGIWLGLLLTTPTAPFPLGLPFALATPSFNYGWRIMYVIGAVLALIGIVMRFRLPESPRWLVSVGRTEEAEMVVKNMEAIASERTLLPALSAVREEAKPSSGIPYRHIFSNPVYLRRAFLLVFVWLFSYVTVYSFAAGMTTWMVGLHYSPPEAGLIVAFGILGFILCSIFAYFFGEKMERKFWMLVASLLTIIGGVIVAVAGTHLTYAIIGAIIVFFGFNLWIPMAYAWTAENFPTRARTTGYGLVDGIGHVGAGIGIVYIAPLIPQLGVMGAFLLIAAFLVVAAIIAQFGIRTQNRSLTELSP